MPEPFKTFFNPEMIAEMGAHLNRANPDFDKGVFVRKATTGLEPLELKARSCHIRVALREALPDDFETACATMIAALHPETRREKGNEIDGQGIAGWAVMPMADFVATHGLDDPGRSLDTLKELTKRFTAEFAVRPFFVQSPQETIDVFKAWAGDENFHVRRLASEGSRPRLPWGLRLHAFVHDPAPLLPILEALKDDSQEYVRRSVANSLNDIAKDHPDLVAAIAKDWLQDASLDRTRLIKHALRSLIKNGHGPSLKALGYGPIKADLAQFEITTPDVEMGEVLEFSATLTSTSSDVQPVIIDYVIHHRKANGETSPKVFKWKIAEIGAGTSMTLKKSHRIKPITTRVYYPGRHHVEVQVNGQVLGRADFTLTL